MQFIKKLSRGILSFLLKLSLFLLAITAALVMIFGTPTQLKKTLKLSNIYSGIVDNVISSTQSNQQNKSDQEGSISLDQPEVKSAIKAAFPPEFLRSSTEQIVDGTYGWLNGKTPQPEFSIDLSKPKQDLANSLGDYAVSRAKSLPVCTLQQARQLQASGIDPLNIPCVPPRYDVNSLHSEVINQINTNQDFLKDPVITSDNLFKNDQGQSPFQKASQAPKIFQKIKLAPYAFAFLALISGTGLVLLYDNRRRGLRNTSIITIGVGAVLFISTWLITYLFNKANAPGGPISQVSNAEFQKTLLSILKSLNTAINNKLFIFSALYIILGAAILLALHFTKPKVVAQAQAKKAA